MATQTRLKVCNRSQTSCSPYFWWMRQGHTNSAQSVKLYAKLDCLRLTGGGVRATQTGVKVWNSGQN